MMTDHTLFTQQQGELPYSKAVIIVNYFDSTVLVDTISLVPVQLGRAIANNKLPIQGDDEGENISAKNPWYCELTGQYWLWKNRPGAEYYGSMHYRRFLDFAVNKPHLVGSHGVVFEPKLTQEALKEYGLDDETISATISGYDLVLPEPYDVTTGGCKSVYEHYSTAPSHYGADLDTAGDIIAELSPEHGDAFRSVCAGTRMYPNNMFVLRGGIFEELNTWLFGILVELEKRLDIRRYNMAEARAIGYIAERLFTVFIVKYLEDHPYSKVLELRRVFFQDTSLAPSAPKVGGSEYVTVAASCDQAYVPQLGARIASTFRNADPKRFIDFFVLDGGITISDKAKLRELCRLHSRCSVTFVEMSSQFKDIETHSYFPTSTFYRLALPELIPDRKKVVFLDTDVVVLKDVAILFDIDLGGHAIAAVPDLIMRAFRALGVESASEASGQRAATYISDVLRIEQHQDAYFQAGVLVFDLEKLRQSKVMFRMQTDLVRNRFWFLDQDVLNKHLFGNVQFLDNRWNVVWMDDYHFNTLSPSDKRTYKVSHEDPYIVHFAGMHKPWLTSIHPHSSYFWTYLRETHWYEILWLEVLRRANIDPKSLLENSGRDAVSNVAAQHDVALLLDERPNNWSMSAKLVSKAWRAFPLSARQCVLPVGERVKSWFVSR